MGGAGGTSRRKDADRFSKVESFVRTLSCGLVLILLVSALPGTVGASPRPVARPAAAPQPSSTILTGAYARMLADPARKRMYFSQHAWGSIVVWNTTSDTMLANVSVGSGPLGMDFSWTGDDLYVGLTGSNSLAVVNLNNLTLTKTISLGVTPVDVAGGRPGRAYVTTNEYWGYPRIVDTGRGVVLGSITAAGLIYMDALARTTLDRSLLFVAETGLSPASIYAFDVTTDSVTLVSTPPFDSVGENLMDFAVSPTQPRLFIASGWPYYVQVVDYRTWTSVGSFNTGPYPSSVGLAQRGTLAFADHESSDVIAYDTSNGTARGTFTFSQGVAQVRSSEDGTKLYAITTDIYGGSVRVERIATGFPAPSGEPPIAVGYVDHLFGYPPDRFAFVGGAAYGTHPYSFAWDFGDGATATGWNVTHIFTTIGVYNVTLTVTDAESFTATLSLPVYLLAPLPPNVLWRGSVFPGEAFTVPENPYVPPDPQVAVGPNAIVEMVNLRIVVWSRDGTETEDIPLYSFFQTPPNEFLSDPRIEYDAPTGRFFASILDVNTNSTLLMVSSGTNLLTGWFRARLPATGCPDQPMLGVGPITVVVSANVFSSCTSSTYTYTGAEYWVVNKTDLLAGRTPQVTSFGPYANGESLHPVQVLGSLGTMYLVSVGWAAAPTNTLQVIPITGSPPNVQVGTEVDLPIRTVNQPPNAPQLGTSYLVNTGDSRVLDAIERGGQLWITFGDACSPLGPSLNQSCARVLQVDPAVPSVVQDFDVGDPIRSYFYPALRFDAAGDLVLAFGYSSPYDYPGLMAVAQLPGDAPDTMRAPLIVDTGTGPEDLYCPDGVSCRFGDYFGVSSDPTDSGVIWVAGETGGPSGWQTTVASVGLTAPVNITLRFGVIGTGLPLPSPTVTYYFRGQVYTKPLSTDYGTYAMDPGMPWSVSPSLPGATNRERWIATGLTSGTATMPVTLTFDYEHDFAVDVQSTQPRGGDVSPASGWYVAGTTLHLNASAGAGWLFVRWLGTVVGTSPSMDIVVSEPLTETAVFNPGLALIAGPGGVVLYSFSNSSGVIPAGTSLTLPVDLGAAVHLYVSAVAGWQFAEWSGQGTGSVSGMSPGVDFVVYGPIIESAVFNPGVTFTASAGGSISYSFANGSGVVPAGTSLTLYLPIGADVQLVALPAHGMALSGWTGTVGGSNSTVSFVVRGPSLVTASFVEASWLPDWALWTLIVGFPLAVAVAGVALVLAWRARRKRPGEPLQGPPPGLPPSSP